MIENRATNKNKIRVVVVAFAIFLSLVLFQNPEGKLGHITALLSIFLVFIFSVIGKVINRKQVLLNEERFLLFLFLLSSVLTTLLRGIPISYVGVFVAQLLLCWLLYNTNISEKEYDFIKYVFIIAMLFCSIMAIRSCVTATNRYFHGDIELFGAFLDPNYIGIPIVFASVLTLGEVLIQKKLRLIGIAAFLVFAVAILYTASRGNFMGFLLGNGLVVLYYLKGRKTKTITKVSFFLLIIVLFFFIFNSSFFDLSNSAERMTSFGEGADNGRFYIWERGVNAWMKHPLFGVGIGGSFLAFNQVSHNTYIEILLETGLLGFVLMMAFIMHLLTKAYKYNKILFYAFCALLLQMTFLDCLINRCFWPYACWVALLPKTKTIKNTV